MPADRITVEYVIAKGGGTVALSKLLGVARTTVLDWKRTNTIPGSRVAQISAALGIPADRLLTIVQGPRSSGSSGVAQQCKSERAAA